MKLRDNPKVAAVAARIQREQGFDPLDVGRVEAAVRRYTDARAGRIKIPGVEKVTRWLVISLLLLAISYTLLSHFPVAVFFAILFLFSLIPTVRALRAYNAEARKFKRQILPYICAYIECIRATTDDPKMQNRIERQWLAEKGLNILPGLHYKVPRP